MVRPTIPEYRTQLEAVRDHLARMTENVAIRGGDLAQFVWAENRGRSVEVYWGEDGIHVAFWERNADTESHTSVLSSYEEAALAAQVWLSES